MYDPFGDTMATAGNKALAGDQAMYDPLWNEWLILDWGPGNV